MKFVKTKVVCVFATKVSPDFDANTLCLYQKKLLGQEGTWQRPGKDLAHVMSQLCNDVAEM